MIINKFLLLISIFSIFYPVFMLKSNKMSNFDSPVIPFESSEQNRPAFISKKNVLNQIMNKMFVATPTEPVSQEKLPIASLDIKSLSEAIKSIISRCSDSSSGGSKCNKACNKAFKGFCNDFECSKNMYKKMKSCCKSACDGNRS